MNAPRPAPAGQQMPRWLPALLWAVVTVLVVVAGHFALRAIDALLLSGTVAR